MRGPAHGSRDAARQRGRAVDGSALSVGPAQGKPAHGQPAQSASDPRLSRLLRWAPLVLAVAFAARLLWTALVPNATNFLDLHVYVDGAARITAGDLYGFRYATNTPEFPLPFTYPPFAALVFFPLSALPFTLVALLWQVGIAAALYAVVRLCQRMLGAAGRVGSRREAMLWTGVGLWTEPVRTTLDYGQVNVFLVLLVLVAASTARWWLGGALVGIAAGIKRTPAITGLFFLARRRFGAAAFSAVVFFVTVGVSWLVIRDETREYIGSYFGDADRIGPTGSVWNQSLFGAAHRFGLPEGTARIVWLVAVVLVCVLAWVAWRALHRHDVLGTLLVVQILGLLVSPVSWSHHWVWVIPLLLWLVRGPFAGMPGARAIASAWAAMVLVGVPWVLSFFQPTIWEIVEPAPLAWIALVYVVGAITVLAWMVWCGRARRSLVSAP
ncbi:mannosyltransferase [Hoyosella sp. G463]|uniref:Mannosyltransferase n=1 Tax=Lolliginicoccus lacisalsi TaxID=2742202 RepID=A0A927PLY0_9ACTN|nr:mannosyltransferase [Lolliginicoccus lacisalsi]